MRVTHILKDGTVLHDISGHVVKMEDAEVVYSIMNKINSQKKGRKHEQRVD